MDRTYLHGICLSFSPMLCLKVHTAFDYLDFLRLCILAQVKSTACICMHKVSQEIVILIHQSPAILVSRYPDTRISNNPDIRRSGLSGYPDIRIPG